MITRIEFHFSVSGGPEVDAAGHDLATVVMWVLSMSIMRTEYNLPNNNETMKRLNFSWTNLLNTMVCTLIDLPSFILLFSLTADERRRSNYIILELYFPKQD